MRAASQKELHRWNRFVHQRVDVIAVFGRAAHLAMAMLQ
jgi:hypothetical protein